MNRWMYVIVAYGGTYDDAWQNNVAVAASLAQAEAEIERRKALDNRANSFARQASEFYYERIRLYVPMTFEIERPKGPAKPTAETMVAYHQELDAWNNAYREHCRENYRLQTLFYKEAVKETRAFVLELFAKHGLPIADYRETFSLLGFGPEELDSYAAHQTVDSEYRIDVVPAL